MATKYDSLLDKLRQDDSALAAHAASHTDGTDDIQSAGAAQKGVVDTAAQTFAGLKTFTTPVR